MIGTTTKEQLTETSSVSRVRQESRLFDIERLGRSISLTKEKLERLELLDAYDMSVVTSKFIEMKDAPIYHIPEQVYMIKTLFGDVTPELVKGLENDFKRWIALIILKPEEQSGPPNRAVDMYWHLFILHTREYIAFCRAVIGRVLGHQPTNDELKEEVDAAGRNTRALFEQLFGRPNTTSLLRNALSETDANCQDDGSDCGGGGDGCYSSCKS